jgi:hypothetical protein
MRTYPRADFWPLPLAHLSQPFLTDLDEYVTIGEISSEPINGFSGSRRLFTAFIPNDKVNAILTASGGIQTEVRCWGPAPCVGLEGGYRGTFWIEGVGNPADRYETPLCTWSRHNRVVLLPDNGLLMCYGLIPRALKNGTISWDDLSKPVYDVVRVAPMSTYSLRAPHYSTARVSIRKDYFEDYLSLKGCAALATYFEERSSAASRRSLAGQQAKRTCLLCLDSQHSQHGSQQQPTWQD